MTAMHACTHDWPDGDPVDTDALARVLGEFGRWHPVAVRQLAEQHIPAPNNREVGPS